METSIDCQNVNPRWLTTKILISLAGKSANWQTSQNRMSLGIWIFPRRNTNTKTQKQQQWQAANGAFSQKIVSLLIHQLNTKTIKKLLRKKDCREFEYPQGPSMDGRIPKGRVQTNQTVERMKYGHLFDFLADLTNSNVLLTKEENCEYSPEGNIFPLISSWSSSGCKRTKGNLGLDNQLSLPCSRIIFTLLYISVPLETFLHPAEFVFF